MKGLKIRNEDLGSGQEGQDWTGRMMGTRMRKEGQKWGGSQVEMWGGGTRMRMEEKEG